MQSWIHPTKCFVCGKKLILNYTTEEGKYYYETVYCSKTCCEFNDGITFKQHEERTKTLRAFSREIEGFG